MFEQLSGGNWQERFASEEKALCLFFKKLCPHCKNMEKVLEKFSALEPGVPLFTLDIEEEPDAARANGVERPPTILIIRGGKVTGKKTGLMNPKETLAFYKKSV